MTRALAVSVAREINRLSFMAYGPLGRPWRPRLVALLEYRRALRSWTVLVCPLPEVRRAAARSVREVRRAARRAGA